MTVHITLQDTQGKLLWQFDWEDRISLAQMAKKSWVDLPLSCCAGMCGICTCKIVSWEEILQIDKITTPLKSLAENEIFACVGGIKSEYLKDTLSHEVVLEKNI
jgi:ferredoxin